MSATKLDDLGNAQGFGDSEAAVMRYDRAGRLAAKAGFAHQLYRLGVHPLVREFIAMSADCILHAYDDDLRLLWRTTLADTAQIQALRRRFAGVTPFRWTVLGCGTKSPADDSSRS